jgi:hypothetical protein
MNSVFFILETEYDNPLVIGYNQSMKRVVTTTLVFLGIVILGLFTQMFVMDDSPLVRTNNKTQTANTADACTDTKLC